MRKAYIGDGGTQIHVRLLAANKDTGDPPLLLLPPAPHSGLYFKIVMPHLNARRDVIAADYPGYGGSDPLHEKVSIAAYARCLLPLLENGADVLGFHSGCLVALELALQNPGRVKNILLVDVPYFEKETRVSLKNKMVRQTRTPEHLSELEESFKAQMSARTGDLGLKRAYELWIEMLRSGEGQTSAFAAAFAYDSEDRFPRLQKPVHVIATRSSLLEASRKAAQVLPNAMLTERLDIDAAVFDKNASKITKTIRGILHT